VSPVRAPARAGAVRTTAILTAVGVGGPSAWLLLGVGVAHLLRLPPGGPLLVAVLGLMVLGSVVDAHLMARIARARGVRV
jgi:hypothetical protein